MTNQSTNGPYPGAGYPATGASSPMPKPMDTMDMPCMQPQERITNHDTTHTGASGGAGTIPGYTDR